ncbi:MAG: hypothetical protein KBC64_06460 [Simkaniaceae bacterium]|nr:hypothetical protein [Simkaniaceae bacterium]
MIPLKTLSELSRAFEILQADVTNPPASLWDFLEGESTQAVCSSLFQQVARHLSLIGDCDRALIGKVHFLDKDHISPITNKIRLQCLAYFLNKPRRYYLSELLTNRLYKNFSQQQRHIRYVRKQLYPNKRTRVFSSSSAEWIEKQLVREIIDGWATQRREEEKDHSLVKYTIEEFTQDPYASYLNLRGRLLKTLPKVFHLACFNRIRTLDLTDNQLSVFPKGIRDLTGLTTLMLNGNPMVSHLPTRANWQNPDSLQDILDLALLKTTLATWVIESPEGEGRIIARDRIFDYLNTPLENTLNLAELSLTALPDIFHLLKLRNTSRLSLRGNQLTFLPQSMQHLLALDSIDLENNKFNLFPSILSKLNQLKDVNLCENPCMTGLPRRRGSAQVIQDHLEIHLVIEQMNLWSKERGNNERWADANECILSYVSSEKEETLHLNSFGLTALPDIFQFSRLKYVIHVRLNDNRLTSLPQSLFEAKKLQKLDLEYNAFTSIPVEKLSGLVHLSLNHNPMVLKLQPRWNWADSYSLTQLSHEIDINHRIHTCLTRWAEIGMRGENRVEAKRRIEAYLIGYDDTILALDGLSLKTLPPLFDFQKFANLEKLYLHNNALHTIPESILSLKKLAFLTLNNNYFINHIEPQDNWRWCSYEISHQLCEAIRLYELLGTWINGGDEGERRVLVKRHIHSYLCSKNSGWGLLGFSQTTLNLNRLALKSMPDIFPCSAFENMKVLNLSYNNLFDLPDTITKLRNVEMLDLSHNRFSYLPRHLRDMCKLRELYLQGNPVVGGILSKDNWAADIRYSRIPRAIFLYYKEAPRLPFIKLARDPNTLRIVNTWLAMVQDRMQRYQNRESRHELKKKIRGFLEEAECNATFRPLFLGIIEEASTSCVDGLTLSLLHLQIACIKVALKPGDFHSTFKTLSKLVLLDLLERIAKEKIAALKAAIDVEIANGIPLTEDQIEFGPHIPIQRYEREIYLIYPARLKTVFQLPSDIDEVVFANFIPITEEDIQEAADQLGSVLKDPEKLHAELLKDPLWELTLKLHYPMEWKKIEDEIAILMEDPETAVEGAKEKERRLIRLSYSSTSVPSVEIPHYYTELLQRILILNSYIKEEVILDALAPFQDLTGRNIRTSIIRAYNLRKEEDYPPLSIDYSTPRVWKSVDLLLLVTIAKELFTDR